jgi:hypothetical protein
MITDDSIVDVILRDTSGGATHFVPSFSPRVAQTFEETCNHSHPISGTKNGLQGCRKVSRLTLLSHASAPYDHCIHQ